MDTPAPKEGMEESPYPDDRLVEGILMIVLDGVRADVMTDSEYMPLLNERKQKATILEIRTGPLTMTGSCVREIATGVQSRPSEGLNNFHPKHPGTPDGWLLASTHDNDGDGVADNKVAMLGDYVWRDLYPDRSVIPFSQHYYGHADFYRGDDEGYEVLEGWLTDSPPSGGTPNVIVGHFSGPDHVGHRYGTVGSSDYIDKMVWTDEHLEEIFDLVPEDWAIIVTADHGQTKDGRHGSPEEVLRKVTTIMWGPNISEGVTIEGVKQRDMATLPSVLLSLPLPHAVDGRIPLEAFSISQEKKDTIEQWNWNAAVARNEWLEEEGWPYVEGLTREVIEWDKLPDDELGVRNSDLIIASIATVLILLVFCWRMKVENRPRDEILIATFLLFSLSAFSVVMSYGQREFPMRFNLLVGGLASMFLFGLSWRSLGMNHGSEWTHQDAASGRWRHLLGTPIPLLCMAAFVLMFPDTRHSLGMYVIWVSCMLLLRHYNTNERVINFAAIALILIFIPAMLLSHSRLLGFDIARGLVVATPTDSWGKWSTAIFSSVIVGFAAGFSTWIRIDDFDWKRIMIHSLGFAILPILMFQQSNTIDWIVLSILIGIVLIGITMMIRKGSDDERLIYTAALAWMAMSWGAWSGTVCLIVIACTERMLAGPWGKIMEKRTDSMQEMCRIILIILFPMTIWYGLWWSLGQVEGFSWDFLYPREIDPGDIFLRGGYIGDRTSPSNEWVGFMGAGPVVGIMFVMWRTFHRIGWPLHLLFAALLVRSSLLWLHLSYAADIPHLVFKTTWDSLYALMLVTTLVPFIAHQLLRKNVDLNDLPNESNDPSAY